MGNIERTYLPAAGKDWALPLYDPFVKLLGGDAARKALLDQAAVTGGHRVLDLGCGTGTLAILTKQLHPDAEVIGLDPDLKALARAREKAKRAAVSVQFDQGFSDELPYPRASFDRVFSSFMFHHLQADQKEKTLREVRRVLRPGGSLHLLDFERPGKGGGLLARWVHSSHHLKDNSEGRILTLMHQAGFARADRVAKGGMFFGLLHFGYFQASEPASAFR